MIYEKSCGAVIFTERDGMRVYLVEVMRKGHLSICKGHVENGESEHETASREILEETGLPVSFVEGFRQTIQYSPYPGCVKTVVFFLARSGTEKTVVQEDEVSEILWLPFEEARDALTHDSDRRTLSAAEHFLREADGNKGLEIRKFSPGDTDDAVKIWNGIVEEGESFPQEYYLDRKSGEAFFSSQSFTGIAVLGGRAVGLYILHPNNEGRCGHICNASYAVVPEMRGGHIGEKLILHSLKKGRELGFTLMQFNAVVRSNVHARHLYERVGFVPLGTVPRGFRMKDGHYEDINLYYKEL